MSEKYSFSKRERGQSLIEMGFSITALIILLAGIVDLGRAFFTFVNMRDAAQEAAVYASAYPQVCDPILKRAQFAMGNVEYDAIEVWIGTHQCLSLNGGLDGSLPPKTEACAEKEVRVVIRDDDFPITMPFLGAIIGTQSFPLRTEITETILRPPQPCN